MTILTFKVFYNENYLAKILSFFVVARKFRIAVDTDLDPSINVHLDGGTSIMFNKYSRGLYYYDTTNMEHNIILFLLTGIRVPKVCA